MIRKTGYFLLFISILIVSSCDINNLSYSSDDNVDNTDFVAKASFSFVVDITTQTQLSLEGINGTVEISGQANATTVTVTGERSVGSESMEDAEEYLKKLEVEVTESANQISVETKQPNDTNGRNFVVNYIIILPENLEVNAENVNGNMTIQNINNDVEADNVNGIIDLKNISGDALADLVNGLIKANVTPPQDGTIDLSTVNGNIELEIPQGTSAEFSASLVNGAIQLTNLTLQNQVTTRSSLKGTLGSGQGKIELNTVNGNIVATGF